MGVLLSDTSSPGEVDPARYYVGVIAVKHSVLMVSARTWIPMCRRRLSLKNHGRDLMHDVSSQCTPIVLSFELKLVVKMYKSE